MKTSFYIHRSGQDEVIDFQFGELNGVYNCSENKVVKVTSQGEEANEMSLQFVNNAIGQNLRNVGETYLEMIPDSEEEETCWVRLMMQPNTRFSSNIKIEKEEDECTKQV